MKQILAKTALALLAASVPFAASAQPAIEGRWVNPKGSVMVRVGPCGDGYCGTVVKASAKAQATARNGGTPHLIGTQILSGLHPAGEGTFKGQVFDPKRNIRAPATIRIVAPDTIAVRGCAIAGMLLCKEQRWTRVG